MRLGLGVPQRRPTTRAHCGTLHHELHPGCDRSVDGGRFEARAVRDHEHALDACERSGQRLWLGKVAYSNVDTRRKRGRSLRVTNQSTHRSGRSSTA